MHLTAGKRARLAIEREIAQPDIHQKAQAAAHFAQHQIGSLIEGTAQLERGEELRAAIDRQQHQFMNAQARESRQHLIRPLNSVRTESLVACHIARSEPPQQCVGLQARAIADGARRVGAILRQEHANVHLVGLGFEPLEKASHAIPDVLRPIALAFEHPLLLLGCEIGPRRVDGNIALACELDQIVLTLFIGLRLPGTDRSCAQGLGRIGNDEPEVDADDATETTTAFAGPERRVEREQTRDRFLIVDIAIGAMQV